MLYVFKSSINGFSLVSLGTCRIYEINMFDVKIRKYFPGVLYITFTYFIILLLFFFKASKREMTVIRVLKVSAKLLKIKKISPKKEKEKL